MGLNFLARPNKHYKGRVREASIEEARNKAITTRKNPFGMSGFVEKAPNRAPTRQCQVVGFFLRKACQSAFACRSRWSIAFAGVEV
jgi:hypothetical protein